MSKVKRSDVAQAAGVAESTVTRALNDSPNISSEVKARVKKVAKKLGYIPNKQASYFAKNQTLRLGLVVRAYRKFPPFSRHYFPKLLDGVVLRAQELGYSISIVLDRNKHGEPVDLVHFVKSREVDGLLFTVIPLHDPRLEKLVAQEIPFVLINNHQQGMISVDGDPYPGMNQAFQLAKQHRHTHIGYIHGDLQYLNGIERLETFTQLCQKYQITNTIVEGNFSKKRGYQAAAELLEREHAPSLIMTASDRTAFGVMAYCSDHHIDIPGQISLIGYDNFGPVTELQPSLTTIDNKVSTLGRAAVDLLVERLEQKKEGSLRQMIPSELVVRKSVGLNIVAN